MANGWLKNAGGVNTQRQHSIESMELGSEFRNAKPNGTHEHGNTRVINSPLLIVWMRESRNLQEETSKYLGPLEWEWLKRTTLWEKERARKGKQFCVLIWLFQARFRLTKVLTGDGIWRFVQFFCSVDSMQCLQQPFKPQFNSTAIEDENDDLDDTRYYTDLYLIAVFD